MSNPLIKLSHDTLTHAPKAQEVIESLFPLERNAPEIQTLKASLAVQDEFPEIDPQALLATYRDKKSGLDLPVFCLHDLYDPEPVSVRVDDGLSSRDANFLLPWERVNAQFFRKERRRHVAWISAVALGILSTSIPMLHWLETSVRQMHEIPNSMLKLFLMLPFLTVAFIACQILKEKPFRRLYLTHRFSGMLPKHIRALAHQMRDRFERLYLIVDATGSWESKITSPPAAPKVDPILVGYGLKTPNPSKTETTPMSFESAMAQASSYRFQDTSRHLYVLATFDLTPAEHYLTLEGLK